MYFSALIDTSDVPICYVGVPHPYPICIMQDSNRIVHHMIPTWIQVKHDVGCKLNLKWVWQIRFLCY